jgi:hypothetical protein
MEVWRIAKWTEVFETAQSRDYKSLPKREGEKRER